MAKFLDTEGVTYHLKQIINNANKTLILISPYLKINERIKSSLEDKDRFKIDIRLVYGKSELQPTENNWLKSLSSVRTSFCKDLHAKCYLNESEAIITSMNLYDYSQVNNSEMGIYVNIGEDPDLYEDIYQEVYRLIRASEDITITVSKVPKKPLSEQKPKHVPQVKGYCIRCGTEIDLNPMVPYCRKCFSAWNKNNEFEEKSCHICGKQNKSTKNKPTCYSCYTKYKNKLEFPIAK